MNIIILTQHPFPYGLAQTNRLISIARGMVKAKAKVKIICTKPTESPHKIRNKQVQGEFENVRFQYSSNETIRKKNPFYRLFRYYWGIINSLRIIIKENKLNKVDVVFSSYRGLIISLIIYFISRIYNIKLIHERSEYPFLSYSDSLIGKIKLKIYLNFVCNLFDGFVVITNALKNYFKPCVSSKTKFYILPILVEYERFAFNRNSSIEYIAYCGSMQGDKDGVPILIESFGEIANDFPELKLYLIGDTDFNGFTSLKNKVDTLNLSDRVMFTGRIERDKLPEYLYNAKLLVLARPSNKQAEGGFPTKLGEYLATGRPVVVTRVGEIPEYLNDKENAFLVSPNSSKDFAEKINEVLTNMELSEKVGLKGKELANDSFSYKIQGEKLLNWINSEILSN